MQKQDVVIRVCWCSPHPNHYNNYLFQHLGALPAIDLELTFFQKVLTKYPWKSRQQIPLRTYVLQKRTGVDWGWLFGQLAGDNRRVFLVAGWNEPTMILLLTYLSLFRRPFMLWSDTPRTERKKNIRNALRAAWLHFIFRRCCWFLVTGNPGMAAAKKVGVPEEKIVNFPFATNTDHFRPTSSSKHNGNRIISSGRLDIAHKGYDTALRALAICKGQMPQLEFEYIIAGTGPDEEHIRKLIQHYGLEKEVKLTGWLEPGQLLAFYQNGDVLLHASNFDPFPNAVLEAMACGLPVIGSDSAGSAVDRIDPGRNGYLFPSTDPESLAQQIIRFLSLPVETKIQMGKNARSTAEKWGVAYHCQVFIEKVQACVQP